MKNPRLVVAHANRNDGFCAATIVRQHWPDAEFVMASYGDDPPDVTDKEVLIVDFSYPLAVVEQMRSVAASFTLLDHHQTARRMSQFDELGLMVPNRCYAPPSRCLRQNCRSDSCRHWSASRLAGALKSWARY